MQTFSYGSAKATYKPVAGCVGLMQAAYYGPVDNRAFGYLRGQIIGASRAAGAILVRMDFAMFAIEGVPDVPDGTYCSDTPAAAVLVRDDSHALWSAYARQAARSGLKRAVFLTWQEALAREWAQDHAALARQQWPRLQ